MIDAHSQHHARVAYEGIEFPTVEFRTQWGHDKVLHQALRTNGADIATTGRKPLVVTCKAALFNDFQGWPRDLYPGRWRQLIRALEDNPLGTLTHPQRGNLDVHVDEVGEPLEVHKRNGVYVELAFTVQGDAAQIFVGADADVGGTSDPGTAMTDRAASADAAALVAVPDATLRPPPLSATVADALAALEGARLGYADAVAQINAVVALVATCLDVPSIAGLAGHDYRAALEAVRAAAFAYRTAYLGTTAPRLFVVPKTMSLARIAALPSVYGDASKGEILRNTNRVADPCFVPAGTVLLVEPIL